MIRFLDLKAINKRFEPEFNQVFKSFLDSGHYILGEEVGNFEQEFASYCGVKYCIGVSNGLDAISLIFAGYKELGVFKEGDEILVPANTYIATVLAISNAGLKPKLVEPSLSSYNIDVNEIKKHITNKTRAILGVHLYGQLYDAGALEAFCKLHDLMLIEDAAQAHGAIYKDARKAGSLSAAAAFSFYPTKNLGALGDAGAITTNKPELAKAITQLRNYGRTSTYKNKIKGRNCRLDEVQATFLRVKLRILDEDNNRRRNIAQYYLDNIKNDKLVLPECEDIDGHVFHLFVIRSANRDDLKAYLLSQGIETLIHYPIPVHQQGAYKELNNLKLSITEKIHDEVLSIPMHPLLEQSQIDNIVRALNRY